MKLRSFNAIFIIIIIIFSAFLIHNIQLWMDFCYSPQEAMLGEMLYFPSGRFLKSAICGFDIVFANFVWLRAIQYYGQHVLTDYDYRWLSHIFNILLELDPRFLNGHRFGGVLISEDGAEPQEAIKILKKAVLHNPGKWEPLYDIGFINYYIVKNYHEAGKYFKLAVLYEGPTGRSIRFAAHSFRKASEYEFAKNLWKYVYETALTEKRKETADRSIRYIQIDENIELIQNEVNKYKKRLGYYPKNLNDLVKKGYLDEIPTEPFRGKYILQDDNGLVTSTTLLYDELELIIRFLNQRITVYNAAKGKYPETLEELVENGFIPEIPKNALGIKYNYDGSKGEVLLPSPVQIPSPLVGEG